MQEFLNNIIPNVMAKLPDFYAAIGDTLLMVVWSGAISFVLGLALGTVLSNVVGYAAKPSIAAILIAVGFSMAIGVFFGYYPANKAAKLDPIEALRYE